MTRSFASSLLVPAAVALVAGFTGAAVFAWSGLGPGAGGGTREYLLAHPEVLPEAMEELQRRELAARIDPLRGQLESPYPGAVLGNPNGTVTLVEFSDYACGFCRQSLADVERLVAANPDLKVVIREYPVLTQDSVEAARMALAAAEQGRYAAFHEAMFAAGRPSPEAIAEAARRAGVDLAQARAGIAAGRYDPHLQTNMMLAQELGISGTPAFIVGDIALNGAVGERRIAEAIEAARTS